MDTSLDRGFVLSFAFINDWLNGGIQLWNRFNQLPYLFTHLQTGFYDLHKFLTALYFRIFEPGPLIGPTFRTPFVIIYLGFTIFIKTLGLYLLLRRFTKSKIILILGILYGNTFLSPTHYVNFTTSNFLSFFPLVVHLVLKFFESKKLTDFYWVLLTAAMLFSFSPYHNVNYTYLTLHFFIISCALFYFLYSNYGNVYRRGIKNILDVLKDIFLDWRSFLILQGNFKQNVRLLVLDASAVALSFSITRLLFGFYRELPLMSGYILTPWLTTAPCIIAIFLLMNFLFGNYKQRQHEATLSAVIRIITAGGTAYLLMNTVDFLDVITKHKIWFFVGWFLSVGLFVSLRYGRLKYYKEFIRRLTLLITDFFRWIKGIIFKIRLKNIGRRNYLYWAMTVLLCLILVLPSLLMTKEILPTLSFDSSRAASISPLSYFNKPYDIADGGIHAFPYLAISHFKGTPDDPLGLRWWATYMFLGFSTLFFALFGIFASKDRRRYIFLMAYLFILFLNWDIPRFLNPLHIINALTNPFSFTNRSFHFVIVSTSPVFLAPLVVMGIQTMIDYANRHSANKKRILQNLFLPCAIFFLSILLVLYVNSAPTKLFYHILKIIMLCSITVYLMAIKKTSRFRQRILLGIVAIIFLLDSIAYADYVKGLLPTPRKLTQPLFSEKSYVMDAVSPRVLPLREYFTNRPLEEFHTGIEGDQDRFHNMYHQFVDLERYHSPYRPSDYCFARHKSYEPIGYDKVYPDYLSQVNQLFMKTRYVIVGTEQDLREIVERDLAEEIVVLNVEPYEEKRLIKKRGRTICDSIDKYPIISSRKGKQRAVKELAIPLITASRIKHDNETFQLYSAKSEEIPKYLTTVIATEDRNRFKARIGSHQLYPVQGEIVEPFSFDVHNMIPDGIVFSLPRGFENKDGVLKIKYKRRFRSGIVDVFRNENDNFGLVVESDSDGWLLYHSPYCKYWKAKINGTPTPIYRANGAFMAVPLQKGINRIEYSYMPGSRIRGLILLSLILSLIILVVFVLKTLIVAKERK